MNTEQIGQLSSRHCRAQDENGTPIWYLDDVMELAAELLSASKPAVALSNFELAKIWAQADDTSDERGAIAYARAVLAADKAASHAAPAQSGEPVAWRYLTPTGWHATTKIDKALGASAHHDMEPLYAAPPAQTVQSTVVLDDERATSCGTPARGVHALRYVIECLRESGWYRDEEGEDTEAMDDLCKLLERTDDPATDAEEAAALRAFDKSKIDGHSHDLESYCAGYTDVRAAFPQPVAQTEWALTCNSRKRGEYDWLHCCSPLGHAGEHCYVTDYERKPASGDPK